MKISELVAESSKYTPTRDKDDLRAKRKAIQDLQLDPNTSKDPELKKEIAKRKRALDMEESATSGGTGSGSVAVAVGGVGAMQKRNPDGTAKNALDGDTLMAGKKKKKSKPKK